MKDGIISGTIPINNLYAWPIQQAADRRGTSAFLCYAIAETETIDGELAGLWKAATVVSADEGHGLFQLTYSYPANWDDPQANALWAIDTFILPAWTFWCQPPYNFVGDSLVRAIAAEFNSGRNNAFAGHAAGNIGLYTSKRPDSRGNLLQYDQVVLNHYHDLLKLGHP